MTTPTTPFSDDDLSAALDGELPADRLAALEADPVARARRDALATAAAAVGAPILPLDPATVDDLVAGALDAPMAPARPARAFRGPKPVLVAATVLVLLAVGLALVWSGRQDGNETAAFNTVGNSISAEAADSASGGGSTSKADTGAPVESAPSTTLGLGSDGDVAATSTVPPTAATLPAPLALGPFTSADALRAALATAFPTTAAPGDSGTVPSAAAVERCATQLQVTLQLDAAATRTGYATVDGRAVLVYEFPADGFDDGQPTTLVAAVGTDACDQVAIFQR